MTAGDINNFNKLTIKTNSTLATFHLNSASLSKHFGDLYDLLALLNHSFDIIGISEHKISKRSNNNHSIYQVIRFVAMNVNAPLEEQVFYISNCLNFKLRSDLLVNEPGGLESSFIEITFPNKRNILCGCLY